MAFDIDRGRVNLPYRVVIYGPEGIGKTSLAAQFPNALFSDTEGSTLRFDSIARIKPRPESWAMLIQQAEYVRDTPGLCESYVIDTADWGERMCQRAICDRSQKGGIEDFGYGKGYTYASEEFGKLLNILTEIQHRGMNVILTAHAAMRKFEQPDEMGAYDRWEMKMHKNVCALVKEWADIVLFANYKTYVVASDDNGKKHKVQGGKRVIYTTHNPCWDAKNRFGMPEEMPMDYNAIAAYLFPTAAPAPAAASAAVAAPAPAAPAPVKNQAAMPPLPAQASKPAAQPGSTQADEKWQGIPDALAALMRANDVQPEEIMYIVNEQKGYYPKGTPIRNYTPDFIQGWAIGMWDKVLASIIANREEVPF